MTLLHLLKLYPNEETINVGDTLVSEHYDELVRRHPLVNTRLTHALWRKRCLSVRLQMSRRFSKRRLCFCRHRRPTMAEIVRAFVVRCERSHTSHLTFVSFLLIDKVEEKRQLDLIAAAKAKLQQQVQELQQQSEAVIQ
jgi:hypothetical protein